MRERLRFSARGARLPEVAPSSLVIVIECLSPSLAGDHPLIAVLAWARSGRLDLDLAEARLLHRALGALPAPEELLALGIDDAHVERIDALAAELATALEAVANVGKTIGRQASLGD